MGSYKSSRVSWSIKHQIAAIPVGLGIDTLSPDTEASGYPVHQAILGAGKYLVENVANADKLPPVGGFSLVMPIPTEGGTEAPIRLIGLVKNNTNYGIVVS